MFFCLCCILLSSSNAEQKEIHFGVKISSFPNGKVVSFLILRGRVEGTAINYNLDSRSFLNFATGKWPLPKTKRRNYFKEHGIEVQKLIDPRNLDTVNYCPAFDSLWKLRFILHPTKDIETEGWSNGYIKPSTKQQAFIYENYGVLSFDRSYFLDSSFYKILRDVVDPEWIQHYKSLK